MKGFMREKPFDDIVDDAIRGAPFDFDGDTEYQGNAAPNIERLQFFLIGHTYAILVCLLGVKLMLFVKDGGANKLIHWIIMKLFAPIMYGIGGYW